MSSASRAPYNTHQRQPPCPALSHYISLFETLIRNASGLRFLSSSPRHGKRWCTRLTKHVTHHATRSPCKLLATALNMSTASWAAHRRRRLEQAESGKAESGALVVCGAACGRQPTSRTAGRVHRWDHRQPRNAAARDNEHITTECVDRLGLHQRFVERTTAAQRV